MTFLLNQVRAPRAKVNFTSEMKQTHGNQNLPLYGPLTSGWLSCLNKYEYPEQKWISLQKLTKPTVTKIYLYMDISHWPCKIWQCTYKIRIRVDSYFWQVNATMNPWKLPQCCANFMSSAVPLFFKDLTFPSFLILLGL